jgi:PAS domain S-box-containing protein
VDQIARAMLALFEAPAAGAAVGFAMYDARLRCVALSESLAAVHGHTAGESIGRTVREVLPQYADELEPILREVLATGRPRLEVEVGPGAEDGRVWLGSYYPLRDAGDAALGAIVVEITDRKRAERALRESSERLSEAQRLAHMGAWTWHVDEQRSDWAEELFDVYGFSGPDAPPIDEWLQGVVEEDREGLMAAMSRAQSGGPFDAAFRFRRPTGLLVHIRTAGTPVFDADGRVIALKGFAQDVTELRRALEQQRAVARLGQAALSGADLDALFEEAVEVVADVMLVGQAFLTERLPDGHFRVRAGRGWRAGVVGKEDVSPTGQSGYTLATGAPVLIEDWEREDRFAYPQLLRDAGARSGASVPIATFGVLGVESVHPHQFGPDDIAFLQSVGNVLAAAIEARRAAGRISELAEARQRLVAQALDAEERTRRAVAESLHDGALQEALVLRHSVGRLLGGGVGGQEEAERVRGAIERVADQLREAMVALHPTVLQAGGLEPALTAVAEQQARIGGFTAEVDVEPAAVGVRDQLVLSIARELLVNAAKHARAHRVDVHVRRAGDGVELEVADDGAGIPEERLRAAVDEGHIGLASSAERVEAVGGRLVIGGGPGRGTVATARLPGGNGSA